MVSVVCRYPGTVSTLVAKRRGYTRRKTEPLQYLRYRRKEQSFCDTVLVLYSDMDSGFLLLCTILYSTVQYTCTVYIHTYIHTYIYSTDFFLRTQRNYIYTKNPPGFSLRYYYNTVLYCIYCVPPGTSTVLYRAVPPGHRPPGTVYPVYPVLV